MKINTGALRTIRRSVGVGMLIVVCGQISTVAAQDRSERQRQFELDRQACLAGKTNQTVDACLNEAKAFLAARPGSNPTVSKEQLQRNALLRCDALSGDDRADCIARIQGAGTVTGSVAAGGVLRSVVTLEATPENPQKPASR